MSRILITGATGTVGREVVRSLTTLAGDHRILAGLRDPHSAHGLPAGVEPVPFDFADSDTVNEALADADVLFLLRPPQMADVNRYFEPLIEEARRGPVHHLVFLSVQGAENNPVIPHRRIERAIMDSGLSHTFLRPAYFMQNFLTTLKEDLVRKKRIFLPAGEAEFTVVDVADVGRVAARVLLDPDAHRNRAYALTNNELLTFGEMATVLSEELGQAINYQSPNLLRFYLQKRREGLDRGFILIMILLHYLPRFTDPPPRSEWIGRITGRPAGSFRNFVREHRESWLAS